MYDKNNKINSNAMDSAELWGTEMPDDRMKEVLVPVCKEGDKSFCHIFEGMTLLCHYCHKICERILCNEIKNLNGKTLWEAVCFSLGKTSNVFDLLRQLIEKRWEY